MYKSFIPSKNIKLSSILTKSILDFNQKKNVVQKISNDFAISKITEDSKNFTSVDLSKKEDEKKFFNEKEKKNLISDLNEFSKKKIFCENLLRNKKRSKSYNKAKLKLEKKNKSVFKSKKKVSKFNLDLQKFFLGLQKERSLNTIFLSEKENNLTDLKNWLKKEFLKKKNLERKEISYLKKIEKYKKKNSKLITEIVETNRDICTIESNNEFLNNKIIKNLDKKNNYDNEDVEYFWKLFD